MNKKATVRSVANDYLTHPRENKGITLIALVVTIIVLLILAGISIMMLTGQNGILNRAGEAKEKTGVAQIEESVKLAVADALTKGTGTVTKDNLEDALNKYVGEGNYDLSDTTEGWLISAGGKDYNVSSSGGISGEDGDDGTYNANYSEKVKDEDIAPADIFLYSVIDEEAKTAKITGMNPVYCNAYADGKVNYNDTESLYVNTNYAINYNGNIISDTLVVPYKWTNEDGKEYTIVEAGLYANGRDSYNFDGKSLPKVNAIIFPNTILKITGVSQYEINVGYSYVRKIILPSNLKSIGNYAFSHCYSMQEINIPESLESLGEDAFDTWYSEQIINVNLKRSEAIAKWNFDLDECTGATVNYLPE